nr:UDP-N-acetylmuramoyl-L-alanyl-D-glutamate--2,6-diaminopimelate ligase MurE homolog, chloroplastic [Ipomoea batatas]
MVSELAGERAMPLPAPASHAELRRVRLQRQIRRGSLLRRSFNFLFLKFSEDRSAVLFFQSIISRSVNILSKVLISFFIFADFNRSRVLVSSWSRVLVTHFFTVFNWNRSVNAVFAIFDRDSWSENLSAVLKSNQSSVSAVLLKASSVKRSSTTLVVDSVCVGRLPTILTQNSTMDSRRSRRGEQLVFASDSACVYCNLVLSEQQFEAEPKFVAVDKLVKTGGNLASVVTARIESSTLSFAAELKKGKTVMKSELVFDGHLHLSEVDKRRAVAVVASKEIDIEESLGCKTLVIVEDTNVVLAVLAASFYRHPSKSMSVIGITGTNGKTTTSYFIKSMYEAMGLRTGMLNIVAYYIDRYKTMSQCNDGLSMQYEWAC